MSTNADTQCLLFVTMNKTGIDGIAVTLGTRGGGKNEQVWHMSSFNKTAIGVRFLASANPIGNAWPVPCLRCIKAN